MFEIFTSNVCAVGSTQAGLEEGSLKTLPGLWLPRLPCLHVQGIQRTGTDGPGAQVPCVVQDKQETEVPGWGFKTLNVLESWGRTFS